MPENESKAFMIDSENLTPTKGAAVKYAMRVREHLAATRAQVMGGLGSDKVTPEEAAVAVAALDAVDRRILRDVVALADVKLPPGYEVGEAEVISKDAQ